MVDYYQGRYIIKESSDFNHANFTLEDFKQRYPNLQFSHYFSNNFHVFINDYYKTESNSYNITRFILDE